MKLLNLFGVALFLFATTAVAYDTTYLVPIKEYGDITQAVELPASKSTITIRGTDNQKLSCAIFDAATGNEASPKLDQTSLCLFNSNMPHLSKVLVKVHNHSDIVLQLYIQVVDAT